MKIEKIKSKFLLACTRTRRVLKKNYRKQRQTISCLVLGLFGYSWPPILPIRGNIRTQNWIYKYTLCPRPLSRLWLQSTNSQRERTTLYAKEIALFMFLKVDIVVGNVKWGGSGRRQMLGCGLGLWPSMIICVLNMQFLCKKKTFFGSACYSRINRRFILQKGSFCQNFWNLNIQMIKMRHKNLTLL